MPTPADSVTLLHVSDMQFGRNHRFGRLGALDPDASFDTLLQRLTDDLEVLKKEPGLTPQIVVVSGDLAELGLPKEFEDARQFLMKLTEFLGLGRERVVIVPGNHDINRKSCEAYFNTCAADEQDPVPPFWPKWKQYAAMFAEFYRELPIRFTVEEPWTWYEVPDLKLVVAGLNSTIAEIHDLPEKDPLYDRLVKSTQYGHFGRVGEEQLRWFAQKLERFQEQGFLRIGVVHHNVQRGATDDDENLRDADLLDQRLGGSLNLLLHGHTHNGKIGWLRQGVPILSTGSAALTQEARPDEVPNQYQVIRIGPDRLERWTRRYDPGQKRWVGDNRCSDNGDVWHIVHGVEFEAVGATFLRRPKSTTPGPRSGGRGGGSKAASRQKRDFKGPDDEDGDARGDTFPRSASFLFRVAQVAGLRDKGADVRPHHLDGPRLTYLLVTVPDRMSVQQHLVGVCESAVSHEDLERFLRDVVARYRAADPGIRSELVYAGEQAPPGLIDAAKRRGVRLLSFVEYQGLIDFGGYLRRQRPLLESDPIYPPRLYVPQRMRYSIGVGRTVLPESASADALEAVAGWMTDDAGRFIVVLANFGIGKTFLLRELARRLSGTPGAPVPILIEMRTLQRALTLDVLIAQHLADCDEKLIDIKKFRYMLETGRIALLFDGFDELAQRVTYESATDHFDTLLEAAGGQAKVVVTSRTHHFESDQQVKTVLLRRAEAVPGLRLCHLQPFDEGQICGFLTNLLGDPQEAAARFALIHEVKDLLGLSETPRMLSFIAELPEEQLRAAKDRLGTITAAELYRLLLDRWLAYDVDRDRPKGTAPTLSVRERLDAVTQVALMMWPKPERTIRPAELTEVVVRVVEMLAERQFDDRTAAHLVGARTLLVRDAEGLFSFVHLSILEWLVANRAAEQLKATGGERHAVDALATARMSPLMADFFCSLAGEQAEPWAQGVLGAVDFTSGDVAQENALLVLKRLGTDARAAVQLAGEDLRGKDFSGQSLIGANFAGANLGEAQFIRTDLTRADLEGARLVRADLTSAKLVGVKLDDAVATGARLLGTDLQDVSLARTSFRRAKMVGAKLQPNALSNCDTFGAALPDSREIVPMISSRSSFNSLALNSDGDLLASGHNDGSVRLWDVVAGHELNHLKGHDDGVNSVAFSPDGRTLAFGGTDRSIRLWDVSTWHELLRLEGHDNWVRCVAFSPDGRMLASGGADSSVRLWDVSTGRELHCLKGHQVRVKSVVFSSDGRMLASGGDDYSMRLWDVSTGRELRRLEGHGDRVWSVAFSPNGRMLASGGDDGPVRLWDVSTGRELRRLEGHGDRVWSVAFSPNGRMLASGDDDGSVRLWDVAAGHELHNLKVHGGVVSVAFSPDGQTLASGGLVGSVRLWDISAGRELPCLKEHGAVVWSVVFSPNGRMLASGGADRLVRLWDVSTGRELRRLKGHGDMIGSVAFSPDGRMLASGSADRSVRLWDVTVNQGLRRLWDVVTGRPLLHLEGHDDMIRCVAFSPDGRMLASSCEDRSIRLWDVSAGRELHRLEGHGDGILSVAFSPDGRTLASGSDDGSVRLWDPRNGVWIATLRGSPEGWCAFTPGGRYKVSGHITGSFWYVIGLCRFEPGELDAFLPPGTLTRLAEDDPLWTSPG
jgi:WD40 repeat protein/3',5'-cyclic AMP phosphodiesterase CpdA